MITIDAYFQPRRITMGCVIPIIIVLVLHCNDVKISVVKLSEIIMIVYGVINIDRFHNVSKWFLAFFTCWLIITFFHDLFFEFDTSVVVSVLQRPYICSVGRYAELFACLAFVELVINYFSVEGFKAGLDNVLKCNSWFCIFLLFLYLLERYEVFSAFDVITHSGRMCGFFNEGGPFGLLMSMMLILSVYFKRGVVEIGILLLCLVLSVSKAGAMLLAVFFVAYYVRRAKYSRQIRRMLLLFGVPILFVFSVIAYGLVKNYSASWIDADYAEEYVSANPSDLSFVAGRVSGRFIVYEMFTQHPIIGIGLGNYPIMRNLDEYRMFFPRIGVYDASGFGGIIDIICQFGMIGLILFVIILYKISRGKNPYLILLFVCVYLCGVQLTFCYPWLLIGINEFYYRLKWHIHDGQKVRCRLPIHQTLK